MKDRVICLMDVSARPPEDYPPGTRVAVLDALRKVVVDYGVVVEQRDSISCDLWSEHSEEPTIAYYAEMMLYEEAKFQQALKGI